jgi:hypothetical protein
MVYLRRLWTNYGKNKKGRRASENSMNKFVKIGLIFVTLVMVVIITDYLTTPKYPTVIGFGGSVFELRPLPHDRINIDSYHYTYTGDIELFYKFKTILSSINSTILVFLLATYTDMYRKLKSEFTIGLILFSLTLLFYALTSNPLLQWIFGYQAFGLGPFAMLPDMFTTLALIVLMYLTMK